MANIAKRSDGTWRARYRDPTGKEHARHFGRKIDAQRWLDEKTASMVTGQYVDPKAGRETVRQYAERWRAIQPHRESTTALYERVLRLHLYAAWGDRPMGSIRHSDARAFVTKLGTTLRPNSVRQVHAITRTIFAAAVADKVIQASPFAAI